MKKVSLAILAAAIILAAVLIVLKVIPNDKSKTDNGDKTNVENNVENNNENNDETNNEAFSPDIVSYNEKLEGIVEQFQPKEELDKEVLGHINGLPISASQVRYAAMYTAYNEEMGITGEELENVATDFYKQNAAVIALAYEYGIELDDTVNEYMSTSVQAMKEYFGTDEEYNKYFEGNPYTAYTYHLTTLQSYLYEQVYAKFCENEDVKNEAVANTLAFYEENDYVRAKHILITFPEGEGENGEVTEEQKAATLEKANAVLTEVNAMGDISEFDALIEKYNEDPGMTYNPDGYFFTRGEMVPEFEESAYTLEEGKTSGLVETTYGYHILLKLPVNDSEAIVNTEKFGEFTTEAFYAMFDERMAAEYEITYADGYSERFASYKNEYYETLAEEEVAE